MITNPFLINPFVIVTDLDSTLVGDNAPLREFNSLFEQHREIHGSKIVYATGRSQRLYTKLRTQVYLLPPDMLITSVGSEIYDANEEMDQTWAVRLSENWNLEIVWQIAEQFNSQLIPQPESEQGPFKASFFLNPEYQTILNDLEASFSSASVQAQIIYSGDRDVDLLPMNSGKGNAVRHIQENPGIPNRTVVCGDSGNDIALLEVALLSENTFGIIVGNARPELLNWYNANRRDNIYLAHSSCAAGILEGLNHFGWLCNG